MFKKSLLALALTGVVGTAAAADITNTAVINVSKEGNSLSTTITGVAIDVDLNAEYTVNDIVTFDFTGVEVNKATFPTSITVAEAAPIYGITLGLLSTTDTQAVYRVTELANGGSSTTTIGATVSMTGLTYKSSTLGSTAAKVVYSAETAGGQELDAESTNTTTIITPKAQFAAEVADGDELDAIIDVNEERKQFTDGDVIDTLGITVTETAALTNAATLDQLNYTVKGDFAFLDTDPDTAGVQIKAGAVAVVPATAAAADLKVTETEITFFYATPSGTDLTPVLTFDLEGDTAAYADEAIPTQTFTTTVNAEYSVGAADANADLLSDDAAGKWALNGAVVHVPFMPFRDGFSPIVNISNTSSQTGDIEVVAYYEDGTAPKTFKLAVQAAAQSQTNITSAIQNAGIEGDVALDIIVNAPKDDIEVNALYFQGGDRAVINTVKQ